MSKAIDLTGQRFGRLIAIEKTDKRKNSQVVWKCVCDCGNVCLVKLSNLTRGHTKSCGCLAKELSINKLKKISHESILLNMKKAHTKENKLRLKISNGDVLGTRATLLTSKISKKNTSGYKGVSYRKDTGKWRAQICFKHKHYNLGSYQNIEDSIQARKIAEEKLFGDFLEWYNNEFKKLPKEKQEEVIK